MKTYNRSILLLLCFILATFSQGALARVETKFDFDSRIHILSDKAYRHANEEVFEAVGNVVATFEDKSLYGEKLTVDTKSGEIEVLGNVRYVAAGMTLYGSRMFVNTKTGLLTVDDARVHSDNYVVLGDKLSRLPDKTIFGEDAEYTTCRDCPESWTISGKEVHITIGEYVKIKHAFVKVKGVVLMYIPYLILPIKKERESGLLFPSVGLDIGDGVSFSQPAYWAIDPYSDMTVTPSVWGVRGYGTKFQYRQNIGDRKWFELNSISSFDKIYQEFRESEEPTDTHYFRTFSQYEHSFDFGNNVNHHLYYSSVKDLDMVRDYRDDFSDKIDGSELGVQTFLDYRFSAANLGIEAHYNRNMLTDEPREFDKDYVQILPKVTASVPPVTLFHSSIPLLNNISVGMDSDITEFKQMKKNEGQYIRNARRLNFVPYVDWNLGRLGPVKFSHNTRFDYQRYDFPNEDEAEFEKLGFIFENEFSFNLRKIFGLAYQEKVSAKTLRKESDKNNVPTVIDQTLVGKVPQFSDKFGQKEVIRVRNSYAHNQEFKVKHIYSNSQKTSGNDKFAKQIENDAGLFDHIDAIRNKENELANATYRTELPISNTLELQWNHSLIKKTPKEFDPFLDGKRLRDNFAYSRVSHFNISQGYDFDRKEGTFEERLTRLYVNAALSVGSFSISASEYYFYGPNDHIFNASISKGYSFYSFGLNFTYDSSSTPSERYYTLTGTYTPFDVLTFDFKLDYDMELGHNTGNEVGVLFTPNNNCWKIKVTRKESLIDTKFGVNFAINFNETNFSTLADI